VRSVEAEQGLQSAGELDRDRNVGADVGAEVPPGRRVVVAEDAGVQLHDQPVVAGHPGHLTEHVLPERSPLLRLAVPRRALAKSCAASLGVRTTLPASGGPWSVAVAPCETKKARRASRAWM